MLENSPESGGPLEGAASDAKVARVALAKLSIDATKNLENLSNTVQIDAMLNYAKDIDAIKPKLTYGLGYNQFVCDTFVKYLFRKAGDNSLDGLYGTTSLYNHFAPEKTNALVPSSTSFTVAGEELKPGDLMFFTDANGTCGHVGVFSRQDHDTGDFYIYDASGAGVGERKIRPSELRSPYSYRNIYYTSPIVTPTEEAPTATGTTTPKSSS